LKISSLETTALTTNSHLEDAKLRVSQLEGRLKSMGELGEDLMPNLQMAKQESEVLVDEAPLCAELEVALNEAVYYHGKLKEAVSLGIRGSEEYFQDALSQVEFLYSPLKVDRSKVYIDKQAHLPPEPEGPPASQKNAPASPTGSLESSWFFFFIFLF